MLDALNKTLQTPGSCKEIVNEYGLRNTEILFLVDLVDERGQVRKNRMEEEETERK